MVLCYSSSSWCCNEVLCFSWSSLCLLSCFSFLRELQAVKEGPLLTSIIHNDIIPLSLVGVFYPAQRNMNGVWLKWSCSIFFDYAFGVLSVRGNSYVCLRVHFSPHFISLYHLFSLFCQLAPSMPCPDFPIRIFQPRCSVKTITFIVYLCFNISRDKLPSRYLQQHLPSPEFIYKTNLTCTKCVRLQCRVQM